MDARIQSLIVEVNSVLMHEPTQGPTMGQEFGLDLL